MPYSLTEQVTFSFNNLCENKSAGFYNQCSDCQFFFIFLSSWFYGKINRVEAQKFLLSSANVHGAFLIRESENAGNNYALSVRDGDVVKHYRIRALDGNEGYFISRKNEFPTLQDLVDHYKKEADGLCDKLGQPCNKVLFTGIYNIYVIYTT